MHQQAKFVLIKEERESIYFLNMKTIKKANEHSYMTWLFLLHLVDIFSSLGGSISVTQSTLNKLVELAFNVRKPRSCPSNKNRICPCQVS